MPRDWAQLDTTPAAIDTFEAVGETVQADDVLLTLSGVTSTKIIEEHRLSIPRLQRIRMRDFRLW